MGILRYLRKRFLARRLTVVAAHMLLYATAFALAFLLRFDFGLPEKYYKHFFVGLALTVVIRTAAGFPFGIYGSVLKYAGIQDLVNIFKAVTMGTVVMVFAVVLLNLRDIPRSIFALDWFAAIMLVGGLRFGLRISREILASVPEEGTRRRVLILGAGDAGESLLRDIQRTYRDRYQVVGFLDDNKKKRGLRIHGVPVLGPIDYLGDYVARYRIDEVIVAIPSASGDTMREIFEICKVAGVHPKTVPGVDQLLDGTVSMSQIRSVAIEDLLGRAPVALDEPLISRFVREKTVMVTGAGGSIGSEICRQVCRFRPSKLLLLDRSEPLLFQIHKEISRRHRSLSLRPLIADVADGERMERIFAEDRPQVIFHAAAHKHVPMMEWNPGEAVKNNIRGTMTVADLAHRTGAQSFVFISTDKAVNPSSVMGATKRASEMYVQALSLHSDTIFTAVRFGNVLGSTGSVIPIFREQIAAGGPVTVTHPEMRRYFMTIPEACQLVMQAAAMGEGGEIFVLDMGEPVKIIDLARDLIKLSGFEPERDIKIEFTGLRPGEKLFEELGFNEEKMRKTRHPKIFTGRLTPCPVEQVRPMLEGLIAEVDRLPVGDIIENLREIVPEFLPSEERYSMQEEPQAEGPRTGEKQADEAVAAAGNSRLYSAWELARRLAVESGFVEIAWRSHGIKPPDERRQILVEADGGERARLTRSVPIDSLAFLEMSLTYPGRPGRKTPDSFRQSARRIGRRIAEEIRRAR